MNVINLNNSKVDFRIGNAFGTEVSKMLITTGGTSFNGGVSADTLLVTGVTVTNITATTISANTISTVSGNVQTQINTINADLALKQYVTSATTGTVISFNTPLIYNSPTTAATTNFTDNLSGAQIGVVQKIYHNNSSAPTFPAGWVKLGTGSYVNSTLNIICCEWVSGSRVEYWIVQ